MQITTVGFSKDASAVKLCTETVLARFLSNLFIVSKSSESFLFTSLRGLLTF